MNVEKEELTGNEEVVESEIKGNETQKDEETQSPTLGAEDRVEDSSEAEKKDPNIYDETGTPWKNRAKEAERKRIETLERVALYQRETPAPVVTVDENEEIVPTRGNVKQVLSELQREELKANDVFDDVINGLIETNPEIANFKNKIAQQVRSVDVARRKDPGFVKAVAFAIYGETAFNKKHESPKPVKKLVGSTRESDVLPPSPKGGVSGEITLTDDENEYAEHHRFVGLFTNEEIREMYQKVKGSKKSK